MATVHWGYEHLWARVARQSASSKEAEDEIGGLLLRDCALRVQGWQCCPGSVMMKTSYLHSLRQV